MADRGVSNLAEQTGKKKQDIPSRLRKIQSSPKRRACTPEPGRKVWTDDSEKDASDADRRGKTEEKLKTTLRSRAMRRTEDVSRRTRSAERAPVDGPESEDDFEAIRNMHKSKELEEEKKEDAAPEVRPKEEQKITPVLKDMPPLIVAPTELKKRARHKSLTTQTTEEFCAKLPKQTPRKLSTSEEEDEVGKTKKFPTKGRRGKTEDGKTRRVRRTLRKERTDASESEGRSHGDDEADGEMDRTSREPSVGPQTEKPVEKGAFSWFLTLGRKSEDSSWKKKPMVCGITDTKEEEVKKSEVRPVGKVSEVVPKREWFFTRMVNVWRSHIRRHQHEYHKIISLKNRCFSQLLLVMIYCGFGGMLFRFVEGAFESFYKCGVKRVKRDFIDSLWNYSQYMLEEDWKSQARRKLMEFENQLHTAHEAGMTTYSGQKSWSFLNSVVYCLTVITTIGYGHISPSTTTGRAITIIYAIFGIPMFLILLADFGKLFTRGIKFLWAFVRRLYYTGSCKTVRKTAPVQEMMKGVQYVYDFAKNRRPSQWGIDEHGKDHHHPNQLRVPEHGSGVLPETPGTPNLSTFEIDDEFNLPISVAITILVIYIFVGATIYWTWESWSFFESFYFVFISMSTIGFGDFVPQNPVYMMASIIYLVFGLALTSMCINVVQEKLTDTFRQASTKIGATIGLRVAEDGTISAPPELADVFQRYIPVMAHL